MATQVFARSTYAQLQELKDELLSVKKSNQMKDDTIAFLQKEKENLIKEVKHYEAICAGVEQDVATQHKYEQELKTLRTDIQHWKEVVKRHRQASKSTLRENTSLDYKHRELVDEMNNQLNTFLVEIPTEASASIKRQLSDIMEHGGHETSWHLLEVTSKALVEIQSHLDKYKLKTAKPVTPVRIPTASFRALESNRKPVMRYSHTFGEPIPHSQPARSAMSRLVKHNLVRRSSYDSTRTQSASTEEFRTIPGFLPGLKKYNTSH